MKNLALSLSVMEQTPLEQADLHRRSGCRGVAILSGMPEDSRYSPVESENTGALLAATV